MQNIPLDHLHAHPANSNVMPPALLRKLMRHIERSHRYPPILVRPLADSFPSQSPQYQILDGHHRVRALRELGRDEALCVVWEVDDDEALLLLATLNRLQGQDDPHRRAALLEQLAGQLDVKELTARLPEQREAIEKLLSLRRPPPAPRVPRKTEDMPVALYFFLLPAQRDAVEATLEAVGPTREKALVHLCETWRPH